jgi:flagellin FlaB
MKKPSKKEDAGAIGIGTLIVFIALILVAAIAAAVIIGTAEELEEQAEQVSDDTTQMIRGPVMIVYAEGDVNNGVIDTVYLYVDLYGSEGIDMRDVVLHVVATPSSGNAVSHDLKFNDGTPNNAGSDNFGTDVVNDPLQLYNPAGTPPTYILGKKAMLKLEIDLSAGSLTTLSPNSMLEIQTFVAESGHTPYDQYRTPSAYPLGGVVKLLGQ